MTEQQMKVLWAKSGGRCARCDSSIIEEGSTGKAYPLAEQAHITARSSKGPRGKSELTAEEREDASNYILLCPTCHTAIDKNAVDWPLGRLRQMKTRHEAQIVESGQQLQMNELAGEIEVLTTSSEKVDGAIIRSPTRIKHGTRIRVHAAGAREVTGVRIEPPGDSKS